MLPPSKLTKNPPGPFLLFVKFCNLEAMKFDYINEVFVRKNESLDIKGFSAQLGIDFEYQVFLDICSNFSIKDKVDCFEDISPSPDTFKVYSLDPYVALNYTPNEIFTGEGIILNLVRCTKDTDVLKLRRNYINMLTKLSLKKDRPAKETIGNPEVEDAKEAEMENPEPQDTTSELQLDVNNTNLPPA